MAVKSFVVQAPGNQAKLDFGLLYKTLRTHKKGRSQCYKTFYTRNLRMFVKNCPSLVVAGKARVHRCVDYQKGASLR
jgi:hypothetical protein